MANFLESLVAQLNRADDRVVLLEIRGEQFLSVAGSELLEQVGKVRAFLRHSGIQPGDRCALLAPNSIAWVAIELGASKAQRSPGWMPEWRRNARTFPTCSSNSLPATLKNCSPRISSSTTRSSALFNCATRLSRKFAMNDQ